MPKPKKVVPIRRPAAKAQVVAADPIGRRIILQIGSKRMAYDFHVTTTELGRHTGDGRAPIVPMNMSGDAHGES